MLFPCKHVPFKMAMTNPLASAFVIILIIFPEITALVTSPAPGSTASTAIESGPDDTVRADPLNNFKRYRGGFNVTNKHYWSSVIFTGACGYAIGLLCLVCGLLYASFVGTTKLCCKADARRKTKSRCACDDFWFILLAILLTILAAAATGIVLAGSSKFYSEARASVNIIIRTANEASQTLYNTTGALKDVQSKLEGSSVGDQAFHVLTSTTHKLDAESALVEMQASKNRHRIHRGLKIAFIITTVTISFNSVAAASLSVCGVLRSRRALYFLIVLCWLMTVMCWLLFGVYFFLDKFSKDACTAFAKFEENPYNSSLSSILPCGRLLSAKTVLYDVSAGIYNFVNQVNANISLQRGSTVHVCNPFSAPPQYSYQPENCPANTVPIADIPKGGGLHELNSGPAKCVSQHGKLGRVPTSETSIL
ncbi:uncharacterized protein LOC129314407 isoform X2 [Prosopis cineraria]|uniref:uncharacterized protein LOC129314407 isoform X2 n=1 Tax=Prosopis cineraria TaxID=364024 RepID=UPI00240FD194|nr:uncharacterized protein LOC129314407 isoform X2 [Prosopis cineraria]